MKAMIITSPGPAENFELKEIEKPKVANGHIVVEVKATSVNPIDTKVRGKQLPFSPDYPAVLHTDFSGIVTETTPNSKFNVGDKVYGTGGGIKGTARGALAQYLLVDEDLTSLMPSNLSFEEAAAMPLVSITAWEALVDKLNISEGSSLLVHGGVGGVGHIAVQLGKHLGATVSTTVSNSEDGTIAQDLGADNYIEYISASVSDYVDNLTNGSGFDFIFDTVGGPNLTNSFEAAKLNGSIACIATGGSHDLTPMYVKGINLFSVLMLIPLMTGKGRAHYGQILSNIKDLVENGKMRPLIHSEVFSWSNITDAHKLVESGKQKGKVVVRID